MIIGIDDTDSRSDGGCTTYIAAVLVEKLQKYGDLADYPLLIRLNPNIRYKTRGNGAVSLNIEIDGASEADEVKEVVLDEVRSQSKLSDENTNPGVVFLDDTPSDMRSDLESFSRRAMQDILWIQDAKDLINIYGIDSCGFKNGRGLIGALAAAAVASNGIPDHTFELITYRMPAQIGTPREVDAGSVMEADMQTYPRTWDTVDIANKAVVCVPHGRDPVLFGIRGEVDGVIDATDHIRSEQVERAVLFKTNQGTDMHLMRSTIDQTRGGRSYILRGVVSSAPRTIHGGHVIFEITDPQSGSGIDCAAFEPTKNFRDIIRQLAVGDRVVVCGSMDDGTVHLEKIKIEHLTALYETRNPVCTCGRRMKSAGTGQGYRCKRCRTASLVPDRVPIKRILDCGWYEVPPSARRHIAKPLVRCAGGSHPVHPGR
ncbi:MAG: tRNA(Ile2) 2-agmatinylcytidine synthetase [Candidatus Methanogaster sp.]|uniref:tRNA(Ile2) 2-agmatinylcytidine synthetase n=1 Tax=Candidatus Methanogaster sp. TaxID=3386292 RepID=A0AC61L010_9EURY|nr:MAG: tRNA(Ile2) 2-agmatinylcytidine synthetase [ANME-2 cluster archaeon]